MSSPGILSGGPVNAFAQLWTEAISSVMSQVASASFPMQGGAGENMPAGVPEDVQLTITAAGTARGEMNLRLPPGTAIDLAKIFVSDTDAARTELTADDRAALEELFRQIAGHVATSARPKGLEIQLTVTLGEVPTWPPAARGWIFSGPTAPRPSQVEWKLSSALATALVSTWREPEAVPAAPAPSQPSSKGQEKLELLMDVELDVVLRFGGRNILLKEILDLGPGSVVELDRTIQDEADLLLDGKLIARGEVVVVERNFGIRITEVLPAQGPA
jgi:flagellar motor switch protein FliN/FliY